MTASLLRGRGSCGRTGIVAERVGSWRRASPARMCVEGYCRGCGEKEAKRQARCRKLEFTGKNASLGWDWRLALSCFFLFPHLLQSYTLPASFHALSSLIGAVSRTCPPPRLSLARDNNPPEVLAHRRPSLQHSQTVGSLEGKSAIR